MITADDLLKAARDQTGLTDLGDDYFMEGLVRLVAATQREVKLNARGEAAFQARAVAYLVNRLEIERWYRIHPEIDDEQIVAPVFGLGLPRTGSTFLQCLMAEDPTARSLRAWESEKPCPPPEAATQDTDPRIAAAEASQAGFNEMVRLAPEMLAMLPLEGPRDPTECQDLMGLSFRSQAFIATVLFDYLDWLGDDDMVPTYRYHKRALKVLQWRCPPKKWRLKSPVHMYFLPALAKVYPDARFVVTHRDVVKSIPSMAAMVAAIGGLFADGLDLKTIGRRTAQRWRIALDRMDAFRDTQPHERFFDVGFRQTQTDPLGTIRAMYAWLGEPLTAIYEDRIGQWRAKHPRDRAGTKVDLADFGLSPEALKRDYARYLARYDSYVAA